MAKFYDGTGRMRDRPTSVLHGLKTTGVVLKVIAFIGFVATYPLWGRLVPTKVV